MVFTLPDNAFAALAFTPTQEQAIIDLADRVVAETLQCSEEFIANNRRLAKHEWKLLKTKEQLQVYKKRKDKDASNAPQRPRLLSGTLLDTSHLHHPHHHNHTVATALKHQQSLSASSQSDRDSESGFGDDTSVFDTVRPPHVPHVVVHGVMPGTVDDLAFGSLANTEYTWRLRNSYVQDTTTYDGTTILATLQSPTLDDPFRFVGVKWLSTGIGAFMSRRDFVYIEATGMALDANGDRVSYELIHSIELNETPELRHLDIIRGRFSKCNIARQFDASSVEIYCRGFLDLSGEVLESMRQNLHADAMLTSANLVECSYLKKLTWQMQRSRRQSASQRKGNSNNSNSSHAKQCDMCDKSLRNLGNLFQSGLACQICRKMLCAKCTVEKRVTVDISDDVTQKMLAFCLPCVIRAKKLSAWDIAVENL